MTLPVIGVVVFPGTNCEHDVAEALVALGGEPRLTWHTDGSLDSVDAVIIPGGFAHGDYLRPGAIARFSPIMSAIADFAAGGGPVVGICNGFQVLTEARLLPGALQRNAGLRFRCEIAEVRVESTASVLTSNSSRDEVLRLPINHFGGNYACTDEDYARLRDEDRIVLTYVTNPNGSRGGIAGICNEAGNVVGLMPHPERACHRLLGSTDGGVLLRSVLDVALARVAA